MGRNNRKKLNEQISSSIQPQLKYLAFIDISSYINRGNGLLTTILSDMGTAKISRLFRPLSTTDMYKSKEQEFKSISSRFISNPSLKTMYLALAKLKANAKGQNDNTQNEKDIQLLVNKIAKMISSKLTDEDKELFNSVSSQLDIIARGIGNKIDSALEPAPEEEKPAEEKPEEKPAEEKPEEKPAEEKPAEETPAEEKPAEEKPEEEKPEDTKKEHLQRRIKNIVREILKKSVTKK